MATAAQIASQPGVVRMEEPVTDLALAEAGLDRALAEAIDALVVMREREGRALESDLTHTARAGLHAGGRGGGAGADGPSRPTGPGFKSGWPSS